MNQWVSAQTHELAIAELMGLQSALSVPTLEFTSERMGWDYDKIRKISQNS